MTEIPIPRVDNLTQEFVNHALPGPSVKDFFDAKIIPAPMGSDTFDLLIQNSNQVSASSKPKIVESVISTLRIENPQIHNPHTIDCVSCHISLAARRVAIRTFPQLNLESKTHDFVFKSKFNLENNTENPGHTREMRAFGYASQGRPVINQRTINETAFVLQQLYSSSCHNIFK